MGEQLNGLTAGHSSDGLGFVLVEQLNEMGTGAQDGQVRTGGVKTDTWLEGKEKLCSQTL